MIPTQGRRDPLLVAGLGLAYGAFAHTFLGDQEWFWQRMTNAGIVLGTLSLAGERSLRGDLRFDKKELALGLATAAGLYGIFQMGDRLARRIVPTGAEDIGDVYALDRLRPKSEIAARLAFVIGPAEELFWRGFVQRRLARRCSKDKPTVPPIHGQRKPTASFQYRLRCRRGIELLSQGERQKILICRALMARFRVLILDEPCAGLDPVAREHFLGWLEKLDQMAGRPLAILGDHVLYHFERTAVDAP